MSAALAVHRPSHTTSHSPPTSDHLQPAPRAYFQPIAPSRVHTPTQIPPIFTTPRRPAPNPMDISPDSGPSVEEHGEANASSGSQVQPATPPVAPQSAESRPPPPAPIIEIKTERPPSPTPPEPSASSPAIPRRRPQRLDINSTASMPPGRPSAPLTAKESGSLSAMQDVAINCLSPGFDTSDPKMRHQMERSRDLAEQQRQIIVARQNKAGPKDLTAARTPSDLGPPPSSFSKPLGTSRRKAPPTSLAIASGAQPSEPRVIQSAPINQTFSGLHRSGHPLSRQVLDHSHHHQHHQHSMAYGQHQQSHPLQAYSPHIQTPQSATRLPPIQDMLANENLGPSRPSATLQRNHSDSQRPSTSSIQNQTLYAPIIRAPASHSPLQPNFAASDAATGSRLPPIQTGEPSVSVYSPSHNPSSQQTASQPHLRPAEREYRSAEEAVRGLTGGREDLLPKVIHYGGHQPPTPPSPLPPMGYGTQQSASAAYPERRPSGPLKVEDGQTQDQRNGSGRRRTREEYERDLDGPGGDERERERERDRARESGGGVGFGFGAWTNEGGRTRHSPETARRKREEFMTLCARAWDLMHE